MVEKLRWAGAREVTLLHVQDERIMKHRTQEQLAAFDQEDRRRLEKRCHHLTDFGFKVSYLIRQGNPAQETAQIADEIKAGLIVIGSQRHPRADDWQHAGKRCPAGETADLDRTSNTTSNQN